MRWRIGQLAKIARPLRGTFANLWRRRTTRPYPRRGEAVAKRLTPVLPVDEAGNLKCVACHLCVSVCPTGCIHVEAELTQDVNREKQPKLFELDLSRCVFCGLCSSACPEEAIRFIPRSKWHPGGGLVLDLESLRAS